MELRIALFGSYYYGYHILETLLTLQDRLPGIEIVGVATDDPTKVWTSPSKRLWKYPHTKEEEVMVTELAQSRGIPVWTGRINTPEFSEIFRAEWQPDICYMSIFGQRIPEHVWSRPSFGFYNFHPCGGLHWPGEAGTSPIEELISVGRMQGSIAMHTIDNEFDRGELVAFSSFFPLTENDNTMTAAKASSRLAASMVGWHIGSLFEEEVPYSPPRLVVEPRTGRLSMDIETFEPESKKPSRGIEL